MGGEGLVGGREVRAAGRDGRVGDSGERFELKEGVMRWKAGWTGFVLRDARRKRARGGDGGCKEGESGARCRGTGLKMTRTSVRALCALMEKRSWKVGLMGCCLRCRHKAEYLANRSKKCVR